VSGYLDDHGKISAGYRPGSFSRIPLAPHHMQESVTPTEDVFVLCHLGVPQLEADSWSLTIDGLVAQPLRLGVFRLDRVSEMHHREFPSMFRQSAATIGADSAHLQRSLERRAAR